MAKNRISRTPSDVFPAGVFELQISYIRKQAHRQKLTNSEDVANYARDVIYREGSIEYAEQFYVLMMDRSNKCYAYKQISSGGLTGTTVDPKLLFQTALLCHACHIILIHNHPSGNASPSNSDLEMTKRLVKAGELLEVKVLDHIILTIDGHYSFADEGML